MKKIPTLYARDPQDRAHVLPEVTAGCEWVLAGEGTATRKWDGTCVLLDPCGDWWARREVKPGRQPPARFHVAGHDEVTGKTVGWEPIAQSPFARFHAEAVGDGIARGQGTYELIGPKVQGNPEQQSAHVLVRHGAERLADVPLDFVGLRAWLLAHHYEGIVWHHPDGRMAKLKRKDFT